MSATSSPVPAPVPSSGPRITILTGGKEFGDPWHRCDQTSAALAQILNRAGLGATIRTDIVDALADGDTDLLVFNCSTGQVGTEVARNDQQELPERAKQGLRRQIAAGTGLLVLHSAVMSFADWPEWPDLIGARWVPNHSFHPPQGQTTIQTPPVAHPLARSESEFVTNDERYTDLEIRGPVTVLAHHRENEGDHPLIWTRQQGGARIVVSVLGHDEQAYEPLPLQALLVDAARWLLAGRTGR